MITEEETIRETNLLFEFVNPQELKMNLIYLLLSQIMNDSFLDQKEEKATAKNIYYLIRFLSKFEKPVSN
jgi:hypothetical protein